MLIQALPGRDAPRTLGPKASGILACTYRCPWAQDTVEPFATRRQARPTDPALTGSNRSNTGFGLEAVDHSVIDLAGLFLDSGTIPLARALDIPFGDSDTKSNAAAGPSKIVCIANINLGVHWRLCTFPRAGCRPNVNTIHEIRPAGH